MRTRGDWIWIGAGALLTIGAALIVGLVVLHVVAQTIAGS